MLESRSLNQKKLLLRFWWNLINFGTTKLFNCPVQARRPTTSGYRLWHPV